MSRAPAYIWRIQTYGSGELDILIIAWLRVTRGTRLGTSLVPGVSGVIDGAWATHHIRSSRYPGCRTGSDQPRASKSRPRISVPCCGRRTRVASLFGASECGPACIKFAVDESRPRGWPHLFGSLAKGCWAPDYPYALRQANMTPGASSFVAEWAALPGSKPSRRAFHAIPKRGLVAGLLRAASSPGGIWACSRRCATPT